MLPLWSSQCLPLSAVLHHHSPSPPKQSMVNIQLGHQHSCCCGWLSLLYPPPLQITSFLQPQPSPRLMMIVVCWWQRRAAHDAPASSPCRDGTIALILPASLSSAGHSCCAVIVHCAGIDTIVPCPGVVAVRRPTLSRRRHPFLSHCRHHCTNTVTLVAMASLHWHRLSSCPLTEHCPSHRAILQGYGKCCTHYPH